jgi:membrane protease subunit HflK
MAWNEPGSGRDPWNPRPNGSNGSNRPNQPFDLEKWLKKLQDQLSGNGSNNGSGSGGASGQPSPLWKWLGLGVLLLWALTAFYTVDVQEKAVVTRFGAVSRVEGAGLHWRLPWPVERVRKVNYSQVRTVSDTAVMLTQDENLVDLQVTVQYRATDPVKYLYGVANAEDSIQQALKASVREVVGQSKMDYILTDGREAIASRSKQLLQTRLNDYGTGLVVMAVNLQNVQPPKEVQDAFADVIKAREDQQRAKNEAEAYANDKVPRARGAAARELAEANAYREQVVAKAEGEASRFVQVLGQYQASPKVTRDRLYLDAMSDVLNKSSKVVLDTKGNPMVYLPLDQLMKKGAEAIQPNTPSVGGALSLPPSGSANTTNTQEGNDPRSRERGSR